MAPRYRLSNLDLDFISLVPAGDDPFAQVVIAKADNGIDWDDIEKKSSSYPGLERKKGNNDNWVESVGGLPSYIERIAKNLHYERGMTISHAIAAAITQCRKWAAGGDGVKPDTKAKAIKALAQWEQKKAKSKAKRINKSGDSPNLPSNLSPSRTWRKNVADEITKDDLPTEVVEYIEVLETTVDSLTEKVTKAESDIEELKKAAPVVQTPADLFEAAIAKADPAVAEILKAQKVQIEQAQTMAKAERDARLETVFLAKADSLPMISDNRQDLARILRAVSDKLDASDAAEVEKILKAANAQIATGNTFAEFGTPGAETTISKSVEAQAEALRKSDPNLTREQALDKVYQSNPDLYYASLKGE